MAGNLAPLVYCAVRTTLCSTLRSDAKELPYQAVMQPVKMLSMVQLYHFGGIKKAYAKSFQPCGRMPRSYYTKQ
jgi:hypothetical protein